MKRTVVRVNGMKYELGDWELSDDNDSSIYSATRFVSNDRAMGFVGLYRTVGGSLFVAFRDHLLPLYGLYCQLCGKDAKDIHSNIAVKTPFTNDQVDLAREHIDDFLRKANLAAFI